MKISIICFTETGKKLGETIMARETEHQISCYCTKEGKQSLSQWVATHFSVADALVFIGATGIAVRGIAPFLESKYKDPAVLVLDERGHFVISLLSGHIGGANALAREVGERIGATPIITTATDCNHLFAVDEWAVKQGYVMENPKMAKEISAGLLEKKEVGIFCDAPMLSLPKELTKKEEGQVGILISPFFKEPFQKTLHLVPKVVHLGMGCKKGTKTEALKEWIATVLAEENIAWESVKALATIDVKKEEQGFCDLCNTYGWDMRTYSPEELQQARGNFAHSAFVEKTVGVDNVCQRAGALSSGNGTEITGKKTGRGMTLSIWIEDWRTDFG